MVGITIRIRKTILSQRIKNYLLQVPSNSQFSCMKPCLHQNIDVITDLSCGFKLVTCEDHKEDFLVKWMLRYTPCVQEYGLFDTDVSKEMLH